MPAHDYEWENLGVGTAQNGFTVYVELVSEREDGTLRRQTKNWVCKEWSEVLQCLNMIKTRWPKVFHHEDKIEDLNDS